MQREAQLALALLARAQSAKVLCRPGSDISVQLHHNAPSGTATDGDIKVDTGATCNPRASEGGRAWLERKPPKRNEHETRKSY